jgi:4-hydroxy-4-methyl-2-oxoglutarate aldolase
VKIPPQISPELLAFLRRTDTCSVSNAIETFNVRMRNEGYIQDALHCITPKLPPVAGYAVTARMRASAPPISGPYYYQRADWWRYVAGMPGPKILVIEDIDSAPGAGALFGGMHAKMSQALGCTACVTNGAVRDLGTIHEMGFHCFAKGVSVSHSYAHIVEFGEPVDIGGLRIASGDLLHGDCNGIQSIPFSVADRLPATVAEIAAHEAELVSLCRSREFSIEKLEEALQKSRRWSPGLEAH